MHNRVGGAFHYVAGRVDQRVNGIVFNLEQQFIVDCRSIAAGKSAMAVGMRIIARRITSAAVPWIGALIAARTAKPACGPFAPMLGVWMRRPNKVWTYPCYLAKALVSSI